MTQQSKAPHGTPDALMPAEMAIRSEAIGKSKATMNATSTFVLAILAGAFIAWGGVFSTTVLTGSDGMMPFGVTRLLAGLAFSLGLILVIVAGAELFTGNNLIVMAWASRRVSTRQLLRNWTIVYAGNLTGAVSIAVLVYLAGFADQGSGATGETMLKIGAAKCNLTWLQAVAAGTGCNLLVCLAVWLCISARSVADKILAVIFPVTAFVATGMEHSVANMYFVPAAMLVKWGRGTADYAEISFTHFVVDNLIPVTIGNIIGGAACVGLVYWFVYLRPRPASDPEQNRE